MSRRESARWFLVVGSCCSRNGFTHVLVLSVEDKQAGKGLEEREVEEEMGSLFWCLPEALGMGTTTLKQQRPPLHGSYLLLSHPSLYYPVSHPCPFPSSHPLLLLSVQLGLSKLIVLCNKTFPGKTKPTCLYSPDINSVLSRCLSWSKPLLGSSAWVCFFRAAALNLKSLKLDSALLKLGGRALNSYYLLWWGGA